MTPDFDRAATAAAEILIKYKVYKAPVDVKRIFKDSPIAFLSTFTEMSTRIGVDRSDLITTFEAESRDAATSVIVRNGQKRYIVAYNTRLSDFLVQRALARELGHIVLGHDGTRPEDVRNAEALTFARHFLCPRALVHSIREKGHLITVEMLGNMTGCYERCLMGMQKTPATHVDPELNRQLKAQFDEYVEAFLDYQSYLALEDNSMLANFGTFMDGYEE